MSANDRAKAQRIYAQRIMNNRRENSERIAKGK